MCIRDSFWVAISARSMCLERCEPRIPQCPGFAHVFFRDLPALTDVKWKPILSAVGWDATNASKFGKLPAPISQLAPLMIERRWRAMQAEMPSAHPCKRDGSTQTHCLVSFTSALKPI